MAVSSDITEYLENDYDIVVNNFLKEERELPENYILPSTAKNYLALLPDLYVVYLLEPPSNHIKSYSSTPLVPRSSCKNTLTLPTVNSKDWRSSLTSPLSSKDVASGASPTWAAGAGLKVGTNQELVITLKGLLS